ncbi:unnamed protein product [Porites lobata]|uniref:Uncharacterized protein n=1 Tax=Porites lobata TaxID=104759 RepID=A0ABN8QA99_9CNID|nr:unnamed protein product [Porites lobata]
MASNNGEHTPKRFRQMEEKEPASTRYIKLNMDKYDSSVQAYSDEDLVKIFEFGLKVKESASLNLDVNQKMMEDALNSKMKPIHETVARIAEQVGTQVLKVQQDVTMAVNSNMTKFATNVSDFKQDLSGHLTSIRDQLTSRVDGVAQKVQPLAVLSQNIGYSEQNIKTEVTGSESRVQQQIAECKEKLDAISNTLEKPNKKGDRAERNVVAILTQNLPCFTFIDTSSEMGKADVEAHSPNNHQIMIEVKNRKRPTDRDEIEKFERNLANSPQFRVGILLSMTSGIARKCREGRFEIAFNQNQKQYQIYVPNASNEEHLIEWSVVMADQLVQLEGELGERKTSELNEIYKKFAANIEHSKQCRSNLEALEICVTNLKENIQPILETVNETKTDIYELLHS